VIRVILKRLLLLPLLLLVVFLVTVFAIVQAPPGDFLTTYVATLASSGSSITAEQVAALCIRGPEWARPPGPGGPGGGHCREGPLCHLRSPR
jgi:ABC-type microcin C transport system permease subunit YejB